MAKLYCLPITKAAHLQPVCAPTEVYSVTRRLLAVQKVVEECGFEDIVPKVGDRCLSVVPSMHTSGLQQQPAHRPRMSTTHHPVHTAAAQVWVERVDAVLPGSGFHAFWHAIWMELAAGVSLEAYMHK